MSLGASHGGSVMASSVLVVDDEPDLLTLYELTLLREGLEVETASSVVRCEGRPYLSRSPVSRSVTTARACSLSSPSAIAPIVRCPRGPQAHVGVVARPSQLVSSTSAMRLPTLGTPEVEAGGEYINAEMHPAERRLTGNNPLGRGLHPQVLAGQRCLRRPTCARAD